jgi:hypothetical protein
MILSENYTKRLKKLSGMSILVEADNRQTIIKKIGLPEEIANWAHALSDKYSIWIANSFKEKYIKDARLFHGMDDVVKDEILKQIRSGKSINTKIVRDMYSNASAMAGEYRHILDWLMGRNNPPVRETDTINFKTLTFDEAKQRSESWHEELARLQSGQIKDEQGDVVMTFPDGFYWIRLNKSVCDAEAKAMGHCGRGRGILYSLRRDKYPYVTVDLEDGVIGQIKGRANTKPKPEYHKYIIPFILNPAIGVKYLKSTYRPDTDFNINDLSEEQLIDISNKKPLLFSFSEQAIKRLSPEARNNILRKNPQVFKGIDQRDFWTPEQLDFILSNAPSILEGQGFLMSLNEKQISDVLKIHPILLRDFNWTGISSWTQAHTGYMLSHNPEFLDYQKIEDLKTAQKISDKQIDWIFDNNPKIFAGQSPTMLLKFNKKQLMKIAEESPESFIKLLDTPFKDENMKSSAIDSEIISILIRNINRETRGFDKFYEQLWRIPSEHITGEHLKYILETYPDVFIRRKMDRGFDNPETKEATLFDNPKIKESTLSMVKYILDNMFEKLNYNSGAPYFENIEHWPLTEKQKDFLIGKQIEGETDVLERQDLYKMNLTKKQVERLVKKAPSIFNPEDQDFEKLGITAKGIIHIISESPGTIPEKKVDEMLSNDEMKALFKKNPNWTNAVYLVGKYSGYNGVKGLKESLSGGFKPDHVEILYDDWQDEALAELFDDPGAIKRIANYELDFYGYDYKYDDIDGSFSDLNAEHSLCQISSQESND